MIGTTNKVTTAVWVGNVTGDTDLRTVYSFPYCPLEGTTQAAMERHCVWTGIQTAINAKYGGSTSWAQPQTQYLDGSGSSFGSASTGVVPDVTGQTESEATATLVSNGFAWAIGSTVASSDPVGTVVSTDPAAGTSLAAHTEVTIHLSSG